MIRRVVLVLTLAGLIGPLAIATAGPAGAVPYGIAVVPTQVLVDRLGGITVSGTVDCTAEVEAAFPGGVPANLTVLAAVNWWAYQPAGRRKMIHAANNPSHAWTCYNSSPDPQLGPVCGGSAGPCRWITSNYGTSSTPFYVYSLDGRFVRGWIHVDTQGTGGYVILGGERREDLDLTDMFALVGYDLRAVRAPRR